MKLAILAALAAARPLSFVLPPRSTNIPFAGGSHAH